MDVSCPECGKTFSGPESGAGSANFKLGGHMRMVHKIARSSKDIASPTAPESPFDQATATDPLGGTAEPAPQQPKRSLKDRLWGAKADDLDPSRPTSPERRPSSPRPRRVDSAGMLSDFWGWMGRKVEEHYSLPTGRALQVEADAAGIILSDLARDTIADRPVQWAARHYEAGSVAIDLFALPVMIEYGARNPGAIPSLAPGIERALLNLGPSLAKAAKKAAKKRADFAESMEGMRDVLGVPAGQAVTIDHMLSFFYPASGEVVTTAQVA